MSISIINSNIDEYNRGSLFAEMEIEKILKKYISVLSQEELINKLYTFQQEKYNEISNETTLTTSWKVGYNNCFKNIIYSIKRRNLKNEK